MATPILSETVTRSAVSPLQIDVTDSIENLIADVISFLPRLVAAIVILLIGWVIGIAVAKLVSTLADKVELDRAVLGTPIGRILGGSEKAVSKAFGTLAKWFVYAIAILTAADVLAIALLSEWIQRAVSYLPAFIAGLIVIVLGFVVADFIGDAITRTRTATQTSYTQFFATGTRLFLYFTAIVIGLDTMGIDVSILFVFANAIAWGLAAAIAIGFGVAFGWGARDYVSENIDRWMGRASSAAPDSSQSSGSSGGGSSGSE